MNTFNQNFNSFIEAFNQNEGESYLEFLNLCFDQDHKRALSKLYTQKLLYSKKIWGIRNALLRAPKSYKILFQIIQQNEEDIISASAFISNFSKRQLLQGVANFLEKKNTELKYNANWNIRFAGGDQRYLETERQGTYLTAAGIEFQELLNRFYPLASVSDVIVVNWDESSENAFARLLVHLGVHNAIRDTLERHLYFDWSLEVINDKTLKTAAPINQREGKIETDIINSIKSKIGIELSYEFAH